MDLSKLDLNDSTRGVLEKAGITTVEDLLSYRDDYTRIPLVGPARGTEIEEALEASEIGLPHRPEPPPMDEPEPPAPEEKPPEEAPAPFGGAQPGDLVIYTSEHGRRRYARLGALNQRGSASLTVFTPGGGRYNEDKVPHSPGGDERSWREVTP